MKAVQVGIFALMLSLILASNISALSTVVVSQLQTADTLAATNEAVEVYNNTSFDQDITNWCIRYSSASSLVFASSPKYCFFPADEYTKIFLSSRSYAVLLTSGYIAAGGLLADGRFSGSGMAASGGHVYLVNALDVPVDVVGWGTAVNGEGYSTANIAPSAPSNTQALSRRLLAEGLLQDTDDNRADFEIKAPYLRTGGVYEVRTPVDVCASLPDIQESLPAGYDYDEVGNCEPLSWDQCSNIEKIQLTLPLHMSRDINGQCYPDICPNVDGLQPTVPTGYSLEGDACLELERRDLWINEVFPNAAGSDNGKEFIEIFNPHSSLVNLSGYTLLIGKNLEHRYDFKDNYEIQAGGFIVLSDDELGTSLLNTSSRIQLIAPAGNIVSETFYTDPLDDLSWALIDGLWQYTTEPSPAAANIAGSVDETAEVKSVTTTAIICAPGKYRHPITNRCRNIEVDTAMLVACDADEYRNPETNRCRKVAALTATLVPCNQGYERNPETNRCRKTGPADTDLIPCQSGYERNLATNRCKKSVTDTPISNPASVVEATSNNMLTNALIVTAGLSAVSYGLYEWRSEFVRGARRLLLMVSGK